MVILTIVRMGGMIPCNKLNQSNHHGCNVLTLIDDPYIMKIAYIGVAEIFLNAHIRGGKWWFYVHQHEICTRYEVNRHLLEKKQIEL